MEELKTGGAKALESVRSSCARMERRWRSKPLGVQLMLPGCFTLALAAVILHVSERLAGGLLVAAGLLLAVGFVIDAYRMGIEALTKPWVKLLVALLATMVVALAMGMASTAVNEATGLDPSGFTYVVPFLAPLMGAYVLVGISVLFVFVTALWFFVVNIASVLTVLLEDRRIQFDEMITLAILRMIGALALGALVWTVSTITGPTYEAFSRSLAMGFTFQFEMRGVDPCAQEGERIHRLTDDVVAVGRHDGNTWVFERRLCPIEAPVAEAAGGGSTGVGLER